MPDAAAEPQIAPYWDVPRPRRYDDRPDEEWIRETRERFALSVSQRLMSDVPLGMFLSGGVDSSAVAAVMKSLSGGPVTFPTGHRAIFLRDPDRNVIELNQSA